VGRVAPPSLLGSASHSGPLPPTLYLAVLFFSFLLPYRVRMVWVYDSTKSVLVVMLMHAPLSASALILISPMISGVRTVIFDLVSGAALWGIVAALVVANRRPALATTSPRLS
jgi:uncharacterized protein